jgi:hypothetical protein
MHYFIWESNRSILLLRVLVAVEGTVAPDLLAAPVQHHLGARAPPLLI